MSIIQCLASVSHTDVASGIVVVIVLAVSAVVVIFSRRDALIARDNEIEANNIIYREVERRAKAEGMLEAKAGGEVEIYEAEDGSMYAEVDEDE